MECTKAVRQASRQVVAVDLFCGAGGLTYGLENAGIDVRLGIDVDPHCRFPYTANNRARFLLKSIEDIETQEVAVLFPKDSLRLLAGCAPCQTFSTYNRRATPTDTRWWLLRQFLRLVQSVLPELLTMENVPRLENQEVFAEFVETLEASQYRVWCRVVDCEEYGVPQRRRRLVLLASRLGPIRLLTPSELGVIRATVFERIADLPPLEAGGVDESDPLHQAAALSATNLRRIKASRPGGTWRDWPESLVADCHKRNTGRTYPSVYGRMSWHEPAPTITTQFYGFGSGRFGHPEQDRAISLREGALLQGFPLDYQFAPPARPIFRKAVGRLIGNAVPVELAEAIGKSIVAHVDTCHGVGCVTAEGGENV